MMQKNKLNKQLKSSTLCGVLFCFFLTTAGSITLAFVSESEKETNTSDTLRTSDNLLNSGQVYQLANNKEFVYQKPKPFQFIQQAPKDLYVNLNQTFKIKNLWKISALAAVTGILVVYDQSTVDEAKRIGGRLNLSPSERLHSYFDFGGLSMRGPTDVSSGIYFLGDGWTHTFIALSFLGYGLVTNNNRALQTASQLVEGFLTTGFTVQLLKHISGRETPNRASVPGGIWRLFPDPSRYSKNQPKYGAYPSGHMATSMMTVTVIAENYPRNKYIRPMGYTLMTLLAFQMMNNGVHWASDYPLGIALGYTFGKIAVNRGRSEVNENQSSMNEQQLSKLFILTPIILGQNSLGLGIQYRF
jgi:hypothetical protein